MEENFGLVMPFKDQSPSFAYGFQCGQIWEKIKNNKKIEDLLITDAIVEQIKMMCTVNHYSCTVSDCSEGWKYLNAELDLTKAN